MTESNGPAGPPGVLFQQFLRQGEFRLQCCETCGRQVFFPRTLCPFCGSEQLEWRLASGRGTVYSTTIVRRRPERGGDYNIAIIELSEGARMMSRVEDISPTEVRIGMAVEAAIRGSSESPLVVFHPVEVSS